MISDASESCRLQGFFFCPGARAVDGRVYYYSYCREPGNESPGARRIYIFYFSDSVFRNKIKIKKKKIKKNKKKKTEKKWKKERNRPVCESGLCVCQGGAFPPLDPALEDPACTPYPREELVVVWEGQRGDAQTPVSPLSHPL